MKIKKIKRGGDSLKERLYLPAIFSGMGVTFSHFIKNLKDTDNLKVVWYPEESPKDITKNYRGVHRLMRADDGSVKCVACFMCATACPSECIFIVAKERENGDIEKEPDRFEIDLLECVFCGGCVEACPKDAIRMDSGIFSFIGGKREDFILDKDRLLSHNDLAKRNDG
ncbi:MAG: NADH-quinone oxidoreductase subunit I [Epsilonproteobacteria bacterium]|nr:NADH-quinone oxidoreductase subunit I [Campylobacterota bacterium]